MAMCSMQVQRAAVDGSSRGVAGKYAACGTAVQHDVVYMALSQVGLR